MVRTFGSFVRLLPPRTRTSFMGFSRMSTSSQRMAQLKSTRKRFDFESAMLDGAPGIGFSFEHGDWSDELSSFCVAAARLAFPPAVHKYKTLLFRRSGFNPTVLIRVSSSSQHLSPLRLRGELRRNPVGLR